MAKILGDAFATVDSKDHTLNRLLDQMLRNQNLPEENKKEIKMYIEFDQLDKQLLNDSLKTMSK